MGRANGVSEAELAALAGYERSPLFGEADRAALAYAEAIATSNSVPDEIFGRVREQFREDETIELTAVVVWELAAAKFNRALEIEGQGICRVAV